MSVLGFIIVTIIALPFLAGVLSAMGGFKEKKEAEKEMAYVIKENGIIDYEYQQFEDNQILINDLGGRKIWVISPDGHVSRFYENITGVELVVDDVTEYKTSLASSAGRAVAGGILAGGIGAVVGGMTGSKSGSKVVQRIELILSYRTGKTAYSKITLLDSKKGESIFGDIYKDIYEDGLHWSKTIAARMS